MGPLDIIAGWQALILYGLCYMLTQLVKTVVDTAMGVERRRANRIITRAVLPAVAPVIGGALALALPMPESLAEWYAAEPLWWIALVGRAGWGAVCGGLADLGYSKLKALVRHAPASEGER